VRSIVCQGLLHDCASEDAVESAIPIKLGAPKRELQFGEATMSALMVRIARIPASRTWPLRHKVMWPDKTIDYVKVPNDEDGMHFGLMIPAISNDHGTVKKDHISGVEPAEDEVLVSVVSLFVDGTAKDAQFRKFATDTDQQGKGYGSQLLSYMFEEIEGGNIRGIEKVWCNARVDKTDFYKRFGMLETEQTFSRGSQDYVIMEKTLN
jgi:ribosomal protein S18 acetylase RimI-like enzyme